MCFGRYLINNNNFSQNISFFKVMAEVNVSAEIFVDAPIDTVFSFTVDPDNAPKWYVNIKDIEWKSPRPLSIGTHIAFKAQFLRKELIYVYEIKELISNKKLVMKTADGPFPMETTYLFEAFNPDRTKVILINRGKPSGFSLLFKPFIALLMRRENAKDLVMLKLMIER